MSTTSIVGTEQTQGGTNASVRSNENNNGLHPLHDDDLEEWGSTAAPTSTTTTPTPTQHLSDRKSVV